jgi:YD repeat-containing protein
MVDWTGTTSYSYDAGRRLVGIAYPSAKTLTYSYDSNSSRTKLLDSDGGVATYTYSGANEMLTIAPTRSSTTTLTYDPNSNRVRFLQQRALTCMRHT